MIRNLLNFSFFLVLVYFLVHLWNVCWRTDLAHTLHKIFDKEGNMIIIPKSKNNCYFPDTYVINSLNLPIEVNGGCYYIYFKINFLTKAARSWVARNKNVLVKIFLNFFCF